MIRIRESGKEKKTTKQQTNHFPNRQYTGKISFM